MDSKGRSSGFALVLILIVVLIVAFLAVKQFSSMGMGKPANETSQTSPVVQAQDAVRQINDTSQKALEALEGFN